jgi:hypothetical protein
MTPSRPSVMARTMTAAKIGLHGSIGALAGLRRTNGQVHQARANASTK